MKKKLLFFVGFFSLFFFSPAPVSAHDATLTYSSISVTETTINVAITTPYKNILALYPEKKKSIDDIQLDFFSKPFAKGFLVENNGEKCAPRLTNIQTIPDIQEVAYQYEFTCKKRFQKLHFSYDLFFNVSYAHENITDIYVDGFSDQIIFSKKTSYL